jgi:Na+/Pi-cotransporter
VSGTVTLLQLAGYVGLLLWGTHMVSTGVERGFGAELRLWLGRTLSRPGGRARLYARLSGLAVTAVLQSSTATGLMVWTFKASPRLRSGTPCLGPEVSKVQKGTVSARDGYLHQSPWNQVGSSTNWKCHRESGECRLIGLPRKQSYH